jgi:hypothetical protein
VQIGSHMLKLESSHLIRVDSHGEAVVALFIEDDRD